MVVEMADGQLDGGERNREQGGGDKREESLGKRGGARGGGRKCDAEEERKGGRESREGRQGAERNTEQAEEDGGVRVMPRPPQKAPAHHLEGKVD